MDGTNSFFFLGMEGILSKLYFNKKKNYPSNPILYFVSNFILEIRNEKNNNNNYYKFLTFKIDILY